MNTTLSRASWTASTVLALVAIHARGGPLEPSLIPPEPAWLVHLDLEAARNSQLGATLLESLGENRRDSINTLAIDLGLSSSDSIRSITIYAPREADSGAALIILGTDADNLPASLQLRNLPEFESARNESTTSMAWNADGKRIFAALTPIDDHRRALVFAKTEISRAHAIERITTPRERSTTRQENPTSRQILIARVLDMNAPTGTPPRAKILKLATGVEASFTEHASTSGKGECVSTIRFTADTPQNAQAMRNLCTGLMQATRLSMSKKPELAEFESSLFDSIDLTVSESTLTVNARHSPADLAMLIEALRSMGQPAKTPSYPNPPK